MALTPAQELFARKYVELNNGTAAYLAAYPRTKSDNAAATNARRLLRNDQVKKLIAELRAAGRKRVEIGFDDVTEGLHSVASDRGSSASARVAAWKALREHLGLVQERTPLEEFLACLPAPVADAVRAGIAQALSRGGA